MSIDELKQKNKELAEEMFKLRLRHTISQLDSPAVMVRVRKDIARIKTVLREKEVLV